MRGIYGAFAARDFASAFEAIDPRIEVDYRGTVIDAAGSYVGHEGMGSLTRRILESFDVESFEVVAEQVVAEGDRVAVALHQRGVGVSSGAPVEIRIGQVWTLRDGKAVRWEIYRSPEEALASLRAAPST